MQYKTALSDLLYIIEERLSTEIMKKMYEKVQKKVFMRKKILYNNSYLFLKGGKHK